jgi:hypothetical protein
MFIAGWIGLGLQYHQKTMVLNKVEGMGKLWRK